jgi:drug/metabolite transporter (DMT)-like permease
MAAAGTAGLYGIFFWPVCFFYGLHYINASRASLIVTPRPGRYRIGLMAAIQGALGRTKIAGIAICIVGACLVIVSRHPQLLAGKADAWIGDLLIFGCVLGWGVYSLFSKALNQSLGPLQTVTWSILLGTLMLWIASAIRGELSVAALVQLGPRQWLSLMYLGVFGSGPYRYYDGILQNRCDLFRVFIALNPLTAVILGALLLGEQLTLAMCLGGGLILTGIFLCNKPLARAGKKGI